MFAASGQSEATTYAVTVSTAIKDIAGNTMAAPNQFSYITIDNGIPSSTVTSPADASFINSASPDPITISGTADDNAGVSGVEISINGGAWLAATCIGCPGANVTWSYSWTLPANGIYTIQSRATDTSSNVETAGAGNTVTIDRTAQTVSSTTPVDSATSVTLDSNFTINFDENIVISQVGP